MELWIRSQDREILFRGKRVDNNEWVYGDLIQLHDGRKYIIDNKFGACLDDKGNFINTESPFVNEVIPETICQYTGLEDRNGNNIFDGDIVQWSNIKMEIFWGEHIGIGYGFCWRPYGEEQSYHESMTGFIDEYEVIGNIFDEKE